MAGLCEGGNEPSGSLKAICNKRVHRLKVDFTEFRFANLNNNNSRRAANFPAPSEPGNDLLAACRVDGQTRLCKPDRAWSGVTVEYGTTEQRDSHASKRCFETCRLTTKGRGPATATLAFIDDDNQRRETGLLGKGKQQRIKGERDDTNIENNKHLIKNMKIRRERKGERLKERKKGRKKKSKKETKRNNERKKERREKKERNKE
ncbi:hypothetical protein ANN_16828 [Periplaneta americana]|uniref:Uncharacterized protein n=1 Tax=Periplaneta americana TaxID=6978 RepID=A0ABQ8SSJ1_PERAM|nr:hypothetical protein ANN_16828 [Periplaneta americana]